MFNLIPNRYPSIRLQISIPISISSYPSPYPQVYSKKQSPRSLATHFLLNEAACKSCIQVRTALNERTIDHARFLTAGKSGIAEVRFP